MDGLWIVITGPSGAGKTVLGEAILREVPNSGKILTCTTRAPRSGEVDGATYRFLSEREFDNKLAENAFVEWKPVHQYRYGALASDLEVARNRYAVVVSVVDPKGAQTISEKFPVARTVFVTAEKKELVRRLRKRGEKDAEIALRMHTRDEEMLLADQFDIVLTNRDLTKTTNTLLSQIAWWRSLSENV